MEKKIIQNFITVSLYYQHIIPFNNKITRTNVKGYFVVKFLKLNVGIKALKIQIYKSDSDLVW